MSGVKLVLLLRDNIIAAEPVCTACLHADTSGRPRRRGERLLCAREIDLPREIGSRYRCRMGFQVAQIYP